ncbi:hypothetical protein [Pseudomonas baltica]|uniref:hypothetical protein n=1 Tax=Pseudomonas baltica TaxID=2762576 RepID=UPI0028A2C076|nr:hypothetical protein [Pseudomonas baltica]
MLIIMFFIAVIFIFLTVATVCKLFKMPRHKLVVVSTLATLALCSTDILCFIKFTQECSDAGTHLYSSHEVDGFYAKGWRIRDAENYIRRGYAYVEIDSGDGRYIKVQRSGTTASDIKASQYSIVHFHKYFKLGAWARGAIIEDSNKAKIADVTIVATQGGYIYHAIWNKFAQGAVSEVCMGRNSSVGDIIIAALPPRKEIKE